MATKAGQVFMVPILLENGASVNAKLVDECTPLWLAAFDGNVAVAKLLLQEGADMEATSRVSRRRSYGSVCGLPLRPRGCGISVVDCRGGLQCGL